MLILHVSIHVKPECIEAFRTATIENARNSTREPGIARFDFLQHADDPNRFSLWEVYVNEDAVTDHKLTSHYVRWTDTVSGMMAEPRIRTWYNNIFPGDDSW